MVRLVDRRLQVPPHPPPKPPPHHPPPSPQRRVSLLLPPLLPRVTCARLHSLHAALAEIWAWAIRSCITRNTTAASVRQLLPLVALAAVSVVGARGRRRCAG
jgi:hypothetical protein